MTNRIAVIAAHPDDEVLGCGGTMARHVRDGDRVDVLIMAEGLTSRDDTRDAVARLDDLAALKQAARAPTPLDNNHLENLMRPWAMACS
jgi:LmbE family N-acetylglucosaminyl deacetylase